MDSSCTSLSLLFFAVFFCYVRNLFLVQNTHANKEQEKKKLVSLAVSPDGDSSQEEAEERETYSHLIIVTSLERNN